MGFLKAVGSLVQAATVGQVAMDEALAKSDFATEVRHGTRKLTKEVLTSGVLGSIFEAGIVSRRSFKAIFSSLKRAVEEGVEEGISEAAQVGMSPQTQAALAAFELKKSIERKFGGDDGHLHEGIAVAVLHGKLVATRCWHKLSDVAKWKGAA